MLRNLSTPDFTQQFFQAMNIHHFRHTVVYCLLHQGMVGHFSFSGNIFLAGKLVRKNESNKIFGIGALYLRRNDEV